MKVERVHTPHRSWATLSLIDLNGLVYITDASGKLQQILPGAASTRIGTFNVALLAEKEINLDLGIFFKSQRVMVVYNLDLSKMGFVCFL